MSAAQEVRMSTLCVTAEAVRALRDAADEIDAELVCCDIYAEREGKGIPHGHRHQICYWASAAAGINRHRADEMERFIPYRKRAMEAEAAIERARDALDSVGVLHPVAADHVLRALDGPLEAASDPEAPGRPGRDEKGSGGRVEALARVLRSVGVEIGYAGADTYRTVVAERILADPGPLLAALAEAGVLEEGFGFQLMRKDGTGGQVVHQTGTGRPVEPSEAHPPFTRAVVRYVTEWRPTDARP